MQTKKDRIPTGFLSFFSFVTSFERNQHNYRRVAFTSGCGKSYLGLSPLCIGKSASVLKDDLELFVFAVEVITQSPEVSSALPLAHGQVV